MDAESKELLSTVFGSTVTIQDFDHGRFIDVVQPLSDLGYLSFSSEEKTIVDSSVFGNALVELRKDIRSTRRDISAIGPVEALSDLEIDDLVETVTPIEMRTLHEAVSLDGDYEVTEADLERGDELSLRILRHRLICYGILDNESSVEKDVISEGLEELTRTITDEPLDEVTVLTGDVDHLINLLKPSKKNSELEPVYFVIPHERLKDNILILDAPCNGRAHPLGTMGSLGLSEQEAQTVQEGGLVAVGETRCRANMSGLTRR